MLYYVTRCYTMLHDVILCYMMLYYICYMIILFAVYEIRLGTIDQPEADTEWRLKPYMNTAKKRLTLSTAPGFEQ